MSPLSRASVYFVSARMASKGIVIRRRIISASFISIRDDVSIFNRAQLETYKKHDVSLVYIYQGEIRFKLFEKRENFREEKRAENSKSFLRFD